MTIAELHGKLSPDRPLGVSERMEDLLTSDIFGTMKYAGWNNGFIDWFLCAEPATVMPSPLPITQYFDKRDILSIKFKFWPTLTNNREPDLALLIEFNMGNTLLIVVEAKYLSGTSDFEIGEEIKDADLTGNQLADQVIGLNAMAPKEFLKWFEIVRKNDNSHQDLDKIHLYITAHSEIPKSDYEHSSDKLGNFWPVSPYWLSWCKLADNLSRHITHDESGADELLVDLSQLLKRKGLVPFSGFTITPLDLGNTDPSFWNEAYWNLSVIEAVTYQSFWN